jgi:mitochondrial chaperone BCS1
MVASMHSEMQHKEGEIVFSWYCRSTEPIKELFEHAKQQYYTCRTNRTTVHRPVGTQNPAFPAYWTKIANRHARPMNTVVLDAEQKMDTYLFSQT